MAPQAGEETSPRPDLGGFCSSFKLCASEHASVILPPGAAQRGVYLGEGYREVWLVAYRLTMVNSDSCQTEAGPRTERQ